jgi:hypothetical protein
MNRVMMLIAGDGSSSADVNRGDIGVMPVSAGQKREARQAICIREM